MSSPSDPRQPRQPGWVIGHVAGAPVVLAPSWLVAAVVLTAAYAPSVRNATRLGAGAYLVAAVFVVLLFASVLVHELAHGIVAKRRGQQPTAFVLTLWGGHTSFVGGSTSPATSALVAVVGPLANLLLAGAFAGLGALAPVGSLASWLAWSGALSNGFVGVFNLLPGLPLDGGRLLEAAVWAGTRDRSRGTEVAGWVGRAVAAGLVLLAVVVPLAQGSTPSVFTVIWALLLAAFLWNGATATIRSARQQRVVQGLTLASVARPALAVAPEETVAVAGQHAVTAGASEVVLVAPDGRPAAYVDVDAAGRVPASAAATTPVSAVAVPLPVGAWVDGRLEGEALLEALSQASRLSPVVAVLVDGRVAGLVRTADVVAMLRV